MCENHTFSLKKEEGADFCIELTLKTISESNSRIHWAELRRLHKVQQFVVQSAFYNHVTILHFPCKIVLTRLAPRQLDTDNLQGAFKYIRDQIAVCIFPEKEVVYRNEKGKEVRIKGHADNDSRISWEYRQEKAKKLGVRIEFFCDDTGHSHHRYLR